MSLNKRCIHIILYILSQNKYIKISQLKENYNVSERTIRYDLSELKYWFKKEQVGNWEIIHSEGVKISCTPETRKYIFELFENKIPNDYFYSSEEREQK